MKKVGCGKIDANGNDRKRIKVALAGNPNSGKTTIFNRLTGARQHVGNYPGVTVERKEGFLKYKGFELQIVDLPGTYSLNSCSAEEMVAENFLIEEKPDVVVDIVDSSNLERNLYLAVQLMEFGMPLVLTMNMSDTAKTRGYELDTKKFESAFHAHVIHTIGHKGEGMTELLDAIIETAGNPETARGKSGKSSKLDYGPELEKELAGIEALLKQNGKINGKYESGWAALKLLEHDIKLCTEIGSDEIGEQLKRSAEQIEKIFDEEPGTLIAGRRYEFISDVCHKAVRSTMEHSKTISDRIDAIATNRVFGLPLFLGLMYLVFHLTFTLGAPLMELVESFFAWSGGAIETAWPEGSFNLLKSLLVDGIIGGVGGVIVFMPNILLLFLAIAVLEDSGYMARAAFIMDRLMHKIGLHGKSFIPMLIGFGCSVPAIMATRTLDNRRDRLTTMLVLPLMSCGARLSIYALIIPAFFPRSLHTPILWIIYIIGILLAVLSAKLLRSTILRGASVPFVMELPPYRMPTPVSVLIHMWERGWLYLKKAGTIILGISIVLWAMTTFPGLSADQEEIFEQQRQEIRAGAPDYKLQEEGLRAVDNMESETALANSIAGRIGRGLEPVLKPMGFDWKIGTALIGAFAAKEVFVAQLGIVYSIGEADEESEPLREKLKAVYTPLIGFCIMLFCLISAPCMATIAVTKRESNSWKWALFQLGGLTLMAYLITVFVYQTGMLLGIGI